MTQSLKELTARLLGEADSNKAILCIDDDKT